MESVSINKTAAPLVAGQVRRDRRVRPHRSARCKNARSGAGPKMWRGQVRRGRAGQAFDFGEPGMLDGATAKSLAAGRHGATTGWPDRQDEAPQAELLADSGSEPVATRARSSSNRRLEQPGTITGLSQGWAGQSPSQSRAKPRTSDRTPAADSVLIRSGRRTGSTSRLASTCTVRRRARRQAPRSRSCGCRANCSGCRPARNTCRPAPSPWGSPVTASCRW